MKLSFVVLIMSVMVFALGGCFPDKAIHAEDLVGAWEVVDAQRNGKATELVNGATFVFGKNGIMKTDITGFDDSGSFSFEEPILTYHGKNEVLYTLNKLTQDSMQLAVDLQGLNFVLDLVRQQSKK